MLHRTHRRAAGMLLAAFLATGPSASQARPRRKRIVRHVIATGYCMGPCRTCETQGLTYMGTRTRRGLAVARRAARRALPMGSQVFIPGYGAARVDDVGGKVGTGQIDLRFLSHRRAARWGRRRVRIVALASSTRSAWRAPRVRRLARR